MKETFYFSHDYNASQDPKILNMISELGIEGYGIYWLLIEKLAEANGKLLLSDLKGMSFAWQVEGSKTILLVENFSLFDKDDTFFWSNRLNDHLKKRSKISQIRAKIGKIGGKAKAKQKLSKSKANEKQNEAKESKVKESKGKDINKIDFEIFWTAYRKKMDKPKCEDKWNKLRLEDQQAILVYIPKYLDTKQVKAGFQKHPTTFLNNRSWENEIKDDDIDITGWSDMKKYEHFGVAGLKKGMEGYN